MSELDQSAQCLISSQDELGELANDVNQLYHRLLCMIENLELEKEKTSENERAKIDFLRSADVYKRQDQMLQMNQVVKFFNLYEIGGKVFCAVPILIISYSCLLYTSRCV